MCWSLERKNDVNVRRLLAQSVKHSCCEFLEGRKLHERKPGRRTRAASAEAARRAKTSCVEAGALLVRVLTVFLTM